jgi:hypothetical protein
MGSCVANSTLSLNTGLNTQRLLCADADMYCQRLQMFQRVIHLSPHLNRQQAYMFPASIS